ncbi:unnamed protein product [Medioppia subpectinata]|uniref:Uncharacterized protein n=1 Tax=Medioppia subpectinata TaxID=1979941 RepID=A0A7R9KYN4_9ACAR|nr:unnamed protein product [Medioppia subpectinata]CAG2112079.1 unnamed protein product [Medioppia subpectinata]
MSYTKATCFSTKEYFETITGRRRKVETDRRLDGQVVVITGANAGIGRATAQDLAKRGAKVIIACRSVDKGEEAANELRVLYPGANVVVMELDLSSLASVRRFAQQVSDREAVVDILINNAGIAFIPEAKTVDGFEMQFGTNHLGHFLLTLHLLPLIKKSKLGKVVTVASSGHLVGKINFDNINLLNGAYAPVKAYGQSKLANILFSRELSHRLGADSTVRTYSLHPGAVNTVRPETRSVASTFLKLTGLTPEMGAQTTLYCALDPQLDNETGCYYANCRKINKMISTATDDKAAKRLWDYSCVLVGLEDNYRI